jgi:RHS repeat-associated protein
MSSATTAGGTVNYLYNGLGQRVAKSGPTAVVPTGAAYYVYDEAGQLLGEYDAAGALVYETIYLGSLPVGAMKQTGSVATSDITTTLYNLHADHIATPRIITRQDHTIVWRWDTAEAFGGTAPDQDPSGVGSFTFNQRFPGQVFDAETGLFQNWNREYNARQGRYIQSDPIGLGGGINTFAYVEGNPLAQIDPLGLANSGAVKWMRNWAEPKPLPPIRPDGQPWGSGCGDEKSDPLVPDLFPNSCKAHDVCYDSCGGPTKAGCDARFYISMLKESKFSMPMTATVYYSSVVLGGESAFKDARSKCTCSK